MKVLTSVFLKHLLNEVITLASAINEGSGTVIKK